MMARLFVLLFVLLTSQARADQFIGVEESPPPASKKDDLKTEAAATTKTAPAPAAESGSFHATAMIGGSRYAPAAHLTIAYYFNRFVSLDLSGQYARYDRGSVTSELYGPDADLVIHVPNPLPLTPFVGAGPGYQHWRRVDDGETFDASSSFTASVFGGLILKFTKNFGLQALRRQVTYLEHAPIAFDDKKTREPKSRVQDQVGFVVTF